MTTGPLAPAVNSFVSLIGEAGARWGLPIQACRVHAFLYAKDEPVSEPELASVLGLDQSSLDEAIDFLTGFDLLTRSSTSAWQTANDPWELLVAGLEARRKRELPPTMEVLRQCHADAQSDRNVDSKSVRQIAKMLQLLESLGALNTQFGRLAPKLIRRVINISGRAAQVIQSRP